MSCLKHIKSRRTQVLLTFHHRAPLLKFKIRGISTFGVHARFFHYFLNNIFQVSVSQQCEKMAVPRRSQPDQKNRRGIQQQLK